MKGRLRAPLIALAVVVLGGLGWAAFAPVNFDSREELFEIPSGTWARRMKGEDLEILPQEIHLYVGVRDILVLRNKDEVPQIFGPTLIMPGQSFKLPFETVSENQFACTAHVAGQMTVFVHEAPITPWTRLTWRADALDKKLSSWLK